MSSRFRALTLLLPLVGTLALPTAASAQRLEGRISTYNVASFIGEPNSISDALLLRTYLTMDKIGGRNMAFRLDMRNEIDVAASTGAFNDRCEGSTTTDPNCEDRYQRHTILGDMDRIAGIYDAYVEFGGDVDKFAFVVGRKTYYEAGALTVDGVELRRELRRGRWGAFAGIAPNPETGIPDPQYGAVGGYYALNNRRMLLRIGTAAQFFDLKPDLVYIHTQDFFQIARGLTASLIAQIDVMPIVGDRLILFDLTYRTSPKYRLRLNVQRYRSVAFAERPLLREQLKPPVGVIDDTQLAIPNPRTFQEATTYHQARLVAQVVTFLDVTVFASGGVRQRTIDGKVAPIFSLGASTYHPVKLPFQGTIRYRYKGGFDSTDHSIGVAAWRKLSFMSPITFGGGVDFVTSSHTAVDPTINPFVSDSSNLFVLSGFFQWDIARYAFYGAYEAALPSKTIEGGNQTSLEHVLVLGFTLRFGQSAKRLF